MDYVQILKNEVWDCIHDNIKVVAVNLDSKTVYDLNNCTVGKINKLIKNVRNVKFFKDIKE